jgi:hypothetical protein
MNSAKTEWTFRERVSSQTTTQLRAENERLKTVRAELEDRNRELQTSVCELELEVDRLQRANDTMSGALQDLLPIPLDILDLVRRADIHGCLSDEGKAWLARVRAA